MSGNDEEIMTIIRKAVDLNGNGQVDPKELTRAIKMANDLEKDKAKQKELKKKLIIESFKQGSFETIVIVIGITLATVLLGFIDMGLFFI